MQVDSDVGDVTLSPSVLLVGPRNQKTLSMSKTNEVGSRQNNNNPTRTSMRTQPQNPLRLSISQGKAGSMTEKKRVADEPKFKIAHMQ